MKAIPFKLAMHVLIWILILVIPYITTDQVFNHLGIESGRRYLLLSLIHSTLLLAAFYFNYYFLIPRFLLTKKYWSFSIMLGLTMIAVFVGAGAIFIKSGFSDHVLNTDNHLMEKIIPVILINTLCLWLLSIISSILWSTYYRLKQTEQEKLSAQVASLKSQINPHFLFNTLNNIYASSIEKAPKAADMVEKLAEMMRYTMKDTQQEWVWLEDELRYIGHYIELQKIRLDQSVKIEYNTIEEPPALRIAPMLIIPFVENAFKHGVNPEQESHIRIKMGIQKTEFQLVVTNRKVIIQKDISESSGLGIDNTRHRLELIYPGKHMLVIDDADTEFSVSLYLNLQ